MGKPKEVVSQYNLTVDGTDVELSVKQKILEMVVDQHSSLPDMFTILFSDPNLELLDAGAFDLTKIIEIKTAKRDGEEITLMKGEITSLEPKFEEGKVAELVVRGYDISHRMYREAKSKAHLNKKDSDLASEIAQSAGLKAKVDQTQTVYEHVYQHNQSDLAFLIQRAKRIGYECFIGDQTLHFRKPPANDSAVTLTWGDDLISFHPCMTLAEQVDEVMVKGWDVEKKAAIIGRAQNGKLYPKIKEAKNGAEWAHAFGNGKSVLVNHPVVSQAEANLLAAARLDELSGAFIKAQGVAYRRPEIKAGRYVTLEQLGTRFSGEYLVTRAIHRYSAEGMLTHFSVTGARTGLMADLLSNETILDRWPGVVPAIVTNTDDPKGWGRVKVKYPWMADDAESDWARVMGMGAGPQAGLCMLPAVDDEVLVSFAHGDFSQPFVLGGVWNGVDKLPPETEKARRGKKPLVRTWHSRSGHWIAMFDDDEKKVEIVTASGNRLKLDDTNKVINLCSKGGHVISLDDNSGNVTITSTGNIKIEARQNLDLQANGQVNIKGATINLN